MKEPPANEGHEPAIVATELLQTLSAVETHTDSLAERLGPFTRPGAGLAAKELTHLREGLKRLTARVGAMAALAEGIAATPEKEPESEELDGSAHGITMTPEDETFPLDGCSDSITGLPARTIAEKAIESALEVGRPRYAALFALDRTAHMANRYGVDVGNQALRHCARFLDEKLPSDSLLFRWRGAAFVTLFDISGTISEAKLVIEQITIQKQKFSFVTNYRSAMVNLTASFQTIAFHDHSTPATIITLIDHFVESHSGRQPH